MKESFYEGRHEHLTDIQLQDVTVTGVTAWPPAAPGALAPDEAGGFRRAEPVNRLLPRTVDWILALPPQVRPHVLAAKYARIANLLCSTWNDPTACAAHFADLLTDRRGGRRGFPREIVKELHALRTHFWRRYPALRDDR